MITKKIISPPEHRVNKKTYTKYVRTKNYFPPDAKTNTTPQLYGTLST